MQRAMPWFVGPAIHGARAAQLLSRSRAHFRERARRAHTGAQQIDAQRSRLIAHSLSRLECRLPLACGQQRRRSPGSGLHLAWAGGGEDLGQASCRASPGPVDGVAALGRAGKKAVGTVKPSKTNRQRRCLTRRDQVELKKTGEDQEKLRQCELQLVRRGRETETE